MPCIIDIPSLSFNLTLNYDFLRDTFSSGYENLHCAAWASGGLLQNGEYQSFVSPLFVCLLSWDIKCNL